MMEVGCVVLERGIMVFGLLRNLLFGVCELWSLNVRSCVWKVSNEKSLGTWRMSN